MTILLQSVTGLLLLAAFVFTLLSAASRQPLWIAVLLLVLANMIAMLFGAR